MATFRLTRAASLQLLHHSKQDGGSLLHARWQAPLLDFIQNRQSTNKHYDRKWRKLRAQKVIKIDLPDYDKYRRQTSMNPEEMRSHLKKEGQLPPRTFQERNVIISSTSSVFEAYVPPEGDGLASAISTEGAKQRLTELEKKGKSFMQVRKIKNFDEDFSTKEFAGQANEIYLEAHNLLQDVEKNEDRLHDLVTERAYPEMTWHLQQKTMKWEFVESIEPPKVVHVRTTEALSKDNLYAQVTVRMHTKQILAIYDRFGRLMYGSKNLVKNVLEYVVFEKHLADEYGSWRIHGKVVPDWMPPRQPIQRTVRKPHLEDIVENEKTSDSKKVEVPQDAQLATA